eukprot:scaffold44820_cov65-Phaeocystis_antarctica.AAC.3
MCIWSHGSHAHGRASAHLNDAVQGVAAKVVVGPLVAVCSGSDAATCEAEGSAAQHGRLFARKTPSRHESAQLPPEKNCRVYKLAGSTCTSPGAKSCERKRSV